MPTDAIVLAGGGAEPGLDPGLPNKGFIPIAGRPLVAYVVAALRGARGIGRVAAVGPVDRLRAVLPGEVICVPDGGAIMDNIVRALQVLGASTPILVAASDIPLLTPAVVEAFVQACRDAPAEFHYAIVSKEAMQQRFPTARKTFVTLTEGTFCGGSVMQFNPAVIDRVQPFVERLIAARKKPWLLAQVFGWNIVLKFSSGKLSIAEMVAKATELVGFAVRPVILPHPELALDADVGKPENLAVIRAALETGGAHA